MERKDPSRSSNLKNTNIYIGLRNYKVYGMGSRAKIIGTLPLLLLCLLFLHAGCFSIGRSGGTEGGLSTPPTPALKGGGIETNPPEAPPKIALSSVLSLLPTAEKDGGVNVTSFTLTKVWGYGVDSSGLARTWVLGMEGGGKSVLLSYSPADGQFIKLDLPITLPGVELKVGELLSPEDLFKMNMVPIVKEMNNLRVGECDLVLDEKGYRVIIHSNSESTTLSFNGKTGELVTSL